MSTNSSSAYDKLTEAQKAEVRRRLLEKMEAARAMTQQLKATLPGFQLEVDRRTLKQFKKFVQEFWHVVEPTQPLLWNWHLDELCQVAEELKRGDYTRVVINVPPGTMKSLLMTVFLRAWLWSEDPGLRFLCGSYGAHLSLRDNVKLREIVTSARYKELYPKFALSSDVNAKERFDTTAGGWSIATSVGGIGTGEHPDYIFVDDPSTEAQARSEVERKRANNWIDRTLSTRGASRNARTLVIMQRLHEEDMSGHLLAQGGWEHICFPMEYVPTRVGTDTVKAFVADRRDQRTTAGQLLWPGLYDHAKLKALKIRLGEYGVAGQLQQQPAPEGGGLFKREWFKFLDSAPVGVKRRARGWDTAGTENAGDFTAGVRISERQDGSFVIEDVIRGQWGPAGVEATMLAAANMDGKWVGQREEKETGSAGGAVILARAKLLKGFDYAGRPISGSKVTRARAFRAQCEAGNVFIVRAPWNMEYLNELCNFPAGQFDDQVDASGCAFNELIAMPEIVMAAPTGVGQGSGAWYVGQQDADIAAAESVGEWETVA